MWQSVLALYYESKRHFALDSPSLPGCHACRLGEILVLPILILALLCALRLHRDRLRPDHSLAEHVRHVKSEVSASAS